MSTYRRSLTILFVAALTISGLAVTASAEEPSPSAATAADRPAIGGLEANQPDQVARGLIVKTTTSTPSEGALDATDDALGSEANVASDDKLAGKISTIDFDETVSVEDASEVAADVARRSDVVWAVPNARRTISAESPITTNDPLFPSQTDLWDKRYAAPKGGYSNKAPALWRATTGSPDVRVAVLDTGIVRTHPDLTGQLLDGYDFVSPDDPRASTLTFKSAGDGNGWDDNPDDPGDWAARGMCYKNSPGSKSSWHGTFVAGQVAAVANNGMGVAGVAPGVKVQPVRVLGRCGGWDSDIMTGILWASGAPVGQDVPVNPTPAQVINLSLSGQEVHKWEAQDVCVAWASVAETVNARGSILVAAAGNAGSDADAAVPAACDGFVSVAATSTRGFSAIYSNVGSTVDIAATGGDTLVEGKYDSVLGLSNTGTTGPRDHSWVRYEGTSMAAPQVSAAAALFYSMGLTDEAEVRSTLFTSVSPFRAKSKGYAKKRVVISGRTYYVDLNCTGPRVRSVCGRGLLDMSKVLAATSKPSIVGVPAGSGPIKGEPLTVKQGGWVQTPTAYKYAWAVHFPDGTTKFRTTGPVFYPRAEDVGGAVSVKVSPAKAPYAKFGATSSSTAPVEDGPVVTLETDSGPTYGDTPPAVVTVGGEDGPVRILTEDGHELARGHTVGGRADLVLSTTNVVPEDNGTTIRAVYAGSGATKPASSEVVYWSLNRRPSTTTASLISTIKRTSRAKLTIRVAAVGDASPTGEIKVYNRNKLILRTRIYSTERGKKIITLPRFKRGTQIIQARYQGSATVAHSSHYPERIYVK